jgi:multiple sugar transport system substrate-binding protein
MNILRVRMASLLGCVALVAAACSGTASPTPAPASSAAATEQASASVSPAASSAAAAGSIKIDLWTPQAGSPPVEVQNMQAMLDAFTAANPQYAFNYKTYPFDAYAKSIQGAAAGGTLPCMLAVDAPNAPSEAWAGWLKPLDLPTTVTDPLIPGAKGTYQGKIYSVGYWDAGLALFSRKSVLERDGIRIPTVDSPWTKDEFDQVLAKLKQDTAFKFPFQLGGADIYSGTPFLWSFGGDLINRDTYLNADGVLNGPSSVAFGKWLQDLVAKKYISTEAQNGNPFISGTVPLIWDGNWDAQSSVDKFGSDLLFLPPPDMGHGIKVGAGSFGYGTSSSCSEDQRVGVNKFLAFSLTTPNLTKIADTQLVIPASSAAAAASTNYGPNGTFKLFADLEANHSEIRPPTPGFTVIGDVFNKAVSDIFSGADVQATLDQAVKDIDADIQANQGYGFK